MATVTSPVAGYEGTVVGVEFKKGVAEVGDPSALAYFRRHGYGIDGATPAATPEPPDPRDVSNVQVGTALRDAAVDPEPGDFLAPTNAGKANPHGPQVVSPGLHATPPAPIVPGPVSSNAKTQEAVETAAAAEALAPGALVVEAPASEAPGEPTSEPADPPAKAAKVAEWRSYAVANGLSQAEADDLTKDELVEMYGG